MADGLEDGKLMTRRDFLAWAAAAAAAATLSGCGMDSSYQNQPEPRKRPRSYSAYAQALPAQPQPVQYVYVQQSPQAAAPRQLQTQRVRQGAAAKVSAMSRGSWGAAAAVPGKMKMMNGVTRVTVHHEGSAKGNGDTSAAAAAKTLRLIQAEHRKRMNAGDIGYHFIIDRTGVIWQGRDWKYQGAHVSKANANNIGVMLLGNFEFQQPTSAQLNSLNGLVASLMRKYGLSPRSDLYGHSDFSSTQCPGKNLKPFVNSMKKTLAV